MNESRLKTLLECYGADPARWPPGEREDALELLSTGGPHVRAWMEDARALDDALSGAERYAAPRAGLHDLVLHAARPAPTRALGVRRDRWASAALAASALLGLALGWASAPHPTGDAYAEELSVGSTLDAWGYGLGDEG